MLLKSIPLRRDCTSNIQGLDMPHLPVYNGATKNIADKLPSNECILMDFNLQNCRKYSVSQFYMFSKI